MCDAASICRQLETRKAKNENNGEKQKKKTHWIVTSIYNMFVPPPKEIYEFWTQTNYSKSKSDDAAHLEHADENAGLARSKRFLMAYKHAGHKHKWIRSRNLFVKQLHEKFAQDYNLAIL